MAPATAIFFETPAVRVFFLRDSRPVQFDYLQRTVLPFLYKKGISRLDALILIDSAESGKAKLSSLRDNFSIKRAYVSAPYNSDSLQADTSVAEISDKPLEWEGLKLFWVFPDNRKEPIGAVVEFKDFTWLEIDQPEFFEKYSGERGDLPVVGCLHYEMFKPNRVPESLPMKMDAKIINGWDFRSNRLVENKLNELFGEKKYWWTRSSGAIEVEFKNGKYNFHPTIED